MKHDYEFIFNDDAPICDFILDAREYDASSNEITNRKIIKGLDAVYVCEQIKSLFKEKN